jgi:hypothetical protein
MIAGLFKDEQESSELEESASEYVDHVCYAYGGIQELTEEDPDRYSGYLSQFTDIDWEEARANPQAYEWVLEHAEDVVDFVDAVDLFPDKITPRLRSFYRWFGVSKVY